MSSSVVAYLNPRSFASSLRGFDDAVLLALVWLLPFIDAVVLDD